MLGRTVLRRLGASLITIAISSFLIYGALYLAPGSPIDFLLGGTQPSPAQVAALDRQYGIGRPLFVGYLSWLNQIVHGHLGTSIEYHVGVWQLISEHMSTTLLLIVLTMLITVVVGLAWGALGAIRGGATDTAVIASSSAALATPPLVAAPILIGVFAVKLGWFPIQGTGSGALGQVWHLTLPAIALAVSLSAMLARVARTSFVEESNREHVLTAVSRGLPQAAVIWRHVVRNSLLPIVTMIGLITAYLITGTIVIEQIFAVDGVGSLLVEAVTRHDFPVVQAISLLIVISFLVVNFLVDSMYLAIDPRLRAR
jgi:peptide/nickel transport system permease protein